MALNGATPPVPITGGSHNGHESNIGKTTENGVPSFSAQLSKTLAAAVRQNTPPSLEKNAHSQHFPLNKGAAHGRVPVLSVLNLAVKQNLGWRHIKAFRYVNRYSSAWQHCYQAAFQTATKSPSAVHLGTWG